MNPDEKLMFKINLRNTDIEFVPPEFTHKTFIDDNIHNSNDNVNLDLFSSEIGFPEICYYSNSRNSIVNIENHTIPTTFDVLRNIDFDLNESEDLDRINPNSNINKIYSEIEQKHAGIFATLYSYKIPRPIARVIVKRLIRLTLVNYDNRNNFL